MQPLVTIPGLEWPNFQVRSLLQLIQMVMFILTADGSTSGSKYTINFYGLRIEITKVGFGKTEDGGQWIGFSGGILGTVGSMQAGASVEGLRIIWYDNGRTNVTFNGIGVELSLLNVTSFQGCYFI